MWLLKPLAKSGVKIRSSCPQDPLWEEFRKLGGSTLHFMAQWLGFSNKFCLVLTLPPTTRSQLIVVVIKELSSPPVGEEARIWEHEYIIFATEGWRCWGGNAVLNRLDRRAGDARKTVANSFLHTLGILSNLIIEVNVFDSFPSTLKDQAQCLALLLHRKT